jgi:hypothetical protein
MKERVFAVAEQSFESSIMSHADYLLSLRSNQIRQIRKAIRVLMIAGMPRDKASDTIISAHRLKYGR